MRITTNRSHLAAALSIVGRAVASNNTMPILKNVLLETEDDALKLTCTDLDTAITHTIPAQIAQNGAATVPVELFGGMVSRFEGDDITLELHDHKMSVRCGKSDYTLLTTPAEDFPVVPVVSNGSAATIGQGTLKELLRRTTNAVAKIPGKMPVLQGLLFEIGADYLRNVATDTYVVLKAQAPAEGAVSKPVQFIMPPAPLSDLMHLLSDKDVTITVRTNGSQAQFEAENTVLVCRLFDGQYPNYEKVLQKQAERKATFKRSELMGAIRRAGMLYPKGAVKKVVLGVGKHCTTIKSEHCDAGMGDEEVPTTLDGKPLTIAFNADLLLTALQSAQSETILMALNGEKDGVVFTEPDNSSWLGVCVPCGV